tara:strand:+ start:78 stop:1007 length:930 start_codon:yes stop_codon:yes gene_type:complete
MSFADRDGWIWFDGEMVPWRDAKVHVLTHTLHYGLGVFEGVRAYEADHKGAAIFRLHDHTDRLFRSAKILNIEIPFSKEQLNEAQKLVVGKNGLNEGYLRPMVFLGSEGMGLRAEGLKVHVIVAAWEWPSYMSPEALEKGIKVRTSSYTRHHPNITMTKAKANGNYINSMLALREALECGCEEALMLDVDGFIAEGSGENFFLVRDGIVYTPELSACLDGITRRTVIQLAKKAGYKIIEKRITRDEVYVADEAFFTGTAAEIMPISELDGRVLGIGHRGPFTTIMQAQYFDLVRGRIPEYMDWLSPVGE